MAPQTAIRALVALALALPIVQMVLVWVRGLLTGMGDAGGATFIGYVSLLCQVVWAVSLVGLVILLAVVALEERPPEEE